MAFELPMLLVFHAAALSVLALATLFLIGRDASAAARDGRSALLLMASGWVCAAAAAAWPYGWADRLLSTLALAGASAGLWMMFMALQGWLGERPFERVLAVVSILTPIGYLLGFESQPVRLGWAGTLLSLQLVLVLRACLGPRLNAMDGPWRSVLAFCLLVMAGLTAARGLLGVYMATPQAFDALASGAAFVALVLATFSVLAAWRTETEGKLMTLAHTDALSGLLNRRGWDAQGGTIWANHERQEGNLALLLMDLDQLKRVNESAGTGMGDRVIRNFGEILHGVVRRGDVVARIGGEEFAVLMPGADEGAARSLDARLRRAVKDNAVPGLSVRVGFSTGLALANAHDHNLEALLTRADTALYHAKSLGRGRLELAPFLSNLSHDYGSSAL